METKVVKGAKFKWSTQAISVYFSWAVAGYVVYYCTDRLGLNSGIIGTLILLAKIVDAITNFIAATIVDNCHFKKGKGRPWAICVIPMWITTILMFSIPSSWGTTAKYIMVFLMYLLLNAVFATIVGCVDNIYLKHAFLDEKMRVSLSTIANGLGTISMAAGSIVMPMLIDYYDTKPHGWTIMTAVIGIPMALLGSIRYFTIPEVDTDTYEKEERVTMKDTIKAFLSNKYTILIMFMCMLVQIQAQFSNAPITYYFKYVVGDISAMSVIGMMSIPAMLILFVLPKLAEKFGRVRLIRVGMVVTVIADAARFFAGDNIPFLCVTTFIACAAIMPFTVLNGLMLIDSMDYDRYRNHRNLEGAVFAGSSLGTTIGNGIGTSISGIALAIFGYDGTKAVQSASAIFGIKASISFIPAIVVALIVLLLSVYDLDKKMPEVKKELERRDKAGEI